MPYKVLARILLTGDFHWSRNSLLKEERWFPGICSFFERVGNFFGLSSSLAEKFLGFCDRMTQKAFRKTLLKIPGSGPYDWAIFGGDYTPGVRESGMITSKSQRECLHVLKMLNICLGNISRTFVLGDHETGYRFNVSGNIGLKVGTEQGGVSVHSIEIAERLLGPSFGSFVVKNCKFIFISTNLIRNVDCSSPAELQNLKVKQESFLSGELSSSKEEMVFVVIHDPTALVPESSVRKILDSHSKKITAIIHGHMHAEPIKWLTMLSPVYRGVCKRFKTILIPATWGFMGIGGGFKVLELIELPDGSRKFIISRFRR